MGDSPETLAVIPARYGSRRFPGKPLAPLAGKPMIQHVVERVRQAGRVARVLVATDDERIRRAVEDFGGEAVLTRREHRSGTERVAEVAAQSPAPIYLNVQADEPLIDPAALDALVQTLEDDSAVQVATLATLLADLKDVMDPNVVKVVADFDANALYFSRAPIPWVREPPPGAAPAGPSPRHFKHLGVYAFRRAVALARERLAHPRHGNELRFGRRGRAGRPRAGRKAARAVPTKSPYALSLFTPLASSRWQVGPALPWLSDGVDGAEPPQRWNGARRIRQPDRRTALARPRSFGQNSFTKAARRISLVEVLEPAGEWRLSIFL
jgi:3-deoxy-manno-octulosonate cytidylyltransferase (CMP-KDO synthetase)